MKPIRRKLRGAQRVVALQTDVLRLRSQAEAASKGGAGPAWRAAQQAVAELYSFSPKRAIALAAQLGDIQPTFDAQFLPTGKTKPAKMTRRANPGWRAWKHEVEAFGIPLGRGRADQHKLKKARASAVRRRALRGTS